MICFVLLAPASNAGIIPQKLLQKKQVNQINHFFKQQETSGTEYWAVLFAVGEYYQNPDYDRPSMLEAVNDLYDILLDSPQWQPDHIRVTTRSQATGQNLIRDLLWLIQNDDTDDMTLVYITTHGAPLRNKNGYPVDLPPKDENDGADEMLVMYHGFARWYAFIWDDLLNFFLSLLQSKGVCLIIDSCYSGGFNDPPYTGTQTGFTAETFTNELAGELSTQNRVVLMSCTENEVSYGSDFTFLLTDGFWGFADIFGNGDGINSAEEAFAYAEFWLELFGQQHPTMLDLYPGEFPVTY
jgi:hypothetical protein